jgi:hypothetical protein
MRSGADVASDCAPTFAQYRHEASADIWNFVWSIPMMDVVMMVLAACFFAVSIAYVYACEQL